MNKQVNRAIFCVTGTVIGIGIYYKYRANIRTQTLNARLLEIKEKPLSGILVCERPPAFKRLPVWINNLLPSHQSLKIPKDNQHRHVGLGSYCCNSAPKTLLSGRDTQWTDH